MDTFDAYLRSDGAAKLSALARAAGVTPGRLSQLRLSKSWPPDLALKIEELTDGKMDAGALSPVVSKARR